MILFVTCLPATGASGNGDRSLPSARELVEKYAGSYDTDALLREDFVRKKLVAMLGDELQHFFENLNVRGSVDLIANTLSLAGNAAHRGGEEEAVLCVAAYNLEVSAAVLSEGLISVFSTTRDYASLNLCIKDWITQVNSGHADRFVAQRNVRMVTGTLH